MTKIFQLASTK